MDAKIEETLGWSDDLVIAAPCTPFLQNGDLNLEEFESYADHMIQKGINGIFVNGTLGEGMSMTVEERKKALDKWTSLKKFKVIIAHVGAGCIRDSEELALHAQSVGANAIAAMCPNLFKPPSVQHLVKYLKAIALRVPQTPFFYYDINILTGVVFDTGEVMRQCKEEIPNFCGIKYSCRELANYELGMMESNNGQYKLALGTVDEVFLPWLSLGARVPICHSFMGYIHADIRQAYLSGNMTKAGDLQGYAQKIGIVKRRYGADVPVSKAMLRLMGLNLGPVRLPLQDVSDMDYKKLEQDLKNLGFL